MCQGDSILHIVIFFSDQSILQVLNADTAVMPRIALSERTSS